MGAVVMVLALKHQLSNGGLLLVQPAQVGRLPVPGAGGAHQFRARRSISAATTSSMSAITWRPDHEYFQLEPGGAAGALPARL